MVKHKHKCKRKLNLDCLHLEITYYKKQKINFAKCIWFVSNNFNGLKVHRV